MTTLSRVIGLAFLVTLVVCLAVVLTGGHPNTLVTDLGDLYHRITT